MPGILSNVFNVDDEDASSEQQAQSVSAEGQHDAGISVPVDVTLHQEGSYTDAEGNTHDYSATQHLGADVSVSTLVDHTLGATDSSESYSE